MARAKVGAETTLVEIGEATLLEGAESMTMATTRPMLRAIEHASAEEAFIAAFGPTYG